MKLSQLLKWIGFFTLIALVYIHMQMQIIHLAYEGKSREKAIRLLNEDNGYLTYLILSMKSSSHLGHKMFNKDSDMDFIDPQNVMFISAGEEGQSEPVLDVADAKKSRSGFLYNLFPLGAQAEARGLE